MFRTVLTVLCIPPLAYSQSKPVAIAASCSPEIVQNLSLPCSADEPCRLFLELSAVAEVGSRIVLTGNIHTGSATIESVLLISDDGGHTWSEAHSRIPAAVLDQVQFVDVETGWVNGHLLSLNVPRDAFFLLTTDGGKTWRRRPITSESRTGAVEQFWFDSRRNGRLALDRIRAAEDGLRYELWESNTGGDSWSIRQVDSRPVPFKMPATDSVLRLATNATSKTYRLERRAGEQWAPLASFAVSAGECKPQAPASVEPPPPEPPEPPPTEPETPKLPRKPPSLKKP